MAAAFHFGYIIINIGHELNRESR